MLRKVKLYGPLADFVVERGGQETMEADISTPAEAIRFLVANWPDLQGHMAEQYYKISTGNFEVEQEELHYPASNEVKIVPVIGGAGGNTGRIILGAALIAAAIAMPASAAATSGAFAGFGSTAGAGWVTKALVQVGASLVLGGIAGMLTPVPKKPEYEQDPKLSYSFGGVQNTTRAGTPVPIIYGEIFTGSVIISAAIDTEQVVA
jgi:predicted phage tail protein